MILCCCTKEMDLQCFFGDMYLATFVWDNCFGGGLLILFYLQKEVKEKQYWLCIQLDANQKYGKSHINNNKQHSMAPIFVATAGNAAINAQRKKERWWEVGAVNVQEKTERVLLQTSDKLMT